MTAKQRRFVAEYVIDLNAAAAARRAGYPEKTARQVGAENLTKPDIRAAIAEAQVTRAERTAITADDVLRGLKREAERTGKGSSHSARVRALALLGEHLGVFQPAPVPPVVFMPSSDLLHILSAVDQPR